MIVVCNSSSLIALSKIGHLEIFEKLFKEIFIPNAVYKDLIIKGLGKTGIAEIGSAGWIKRRYVKNTKLVKKLNISLHSGESEAIVLAKELKADFIILDDRRARNLAKMERLNVIGLLAVLIKAKEMGVISKIKPIVDSLRRNDFFMKESLFLDILNKADEL